MKEGDKVEVISTECCEGHPVGTIGFITHIEEKSTGNDILVKEPNSRVTFWQCEKCIKVL